MRTMANTIPYRYVPIALLGLGTAFGLWAGCSSNDSQKEVTSQATQAIGVPPATEVPLDSTTIPKNANQLPILPDWAPTVIRNGSGVVIRNEYTISDLETTVQMLPPGYPPTTVFAMTGPVVGGGTFTGSPAAIFENTRGIPTVMHWRGNVQAPAFLAVDPTIPWAKPPSLEIPQSPFNLWPPGYQTAQFPVARVTHTHGLMVLPQMDGTAEEWFTPGLNYKGPSYVTDDYTMPNDQPGTQLFYHDHVLGVTRLGVYGGGVGAAAMIPDPTP